MPSEHSRSSSGSSVTSVPTINVKYAPPQLKKNQLNSTSNNELLDISNGTSREKSPSRERDSRGKSPGRNGKRGKSPSGDKLDPPKSPNSSRSRSRSRSKSPRNKKENERNENSKNSKSTQDARVNLNLNVAPWIAPSAKTSGGSKSNSRSSRLSLPPNFSEINMNAIRESNERWERLNHVPNDSKDGGKNGMGNFSKPVPLRIAPLIRPKIVTDMNNLQGGKSMQRNPSGQLTGKLTESPLVVDAGFPLMRSRSYNSAINESHRVHTEFSRDLKPHPLQHSWTMYYDSKPAMTPGPKTPTGKISYEENLQTIGTFNTVETFCRYFNWVKKPSQLELNTNFHIFKDKIMPMWEDPANAN
ncbi:1883_t:CDS:2, partial [Acaulospora morrowiae]